jgi:hypothetical protein
MAKRSSAKNSFPNVDLRENNEGKIRPRFKPGPLERRRRKKLGLPLSFDLRHADGAWYTRDEVAEFCRTEAWKPAAADPAAPIEKPRQRRVIDLVEDWFASIEKAGELSPKTIASYKKNKAALLYKPRSRAERAAEKPLEIEPFVLARVTAIEEPEVVAYYNYQKAKRGHHMALAIVATLSAAFTWGKLNPYWRTRDNPALKLDLARPDGRVVFYLDHELRALLAAADHLRRPSIGDAILLGLFTAQRQGDRLELEDAGLVNGRRVFKQSKTGVIVEVPETGRLKERLEQAAERRAAIALRLEQKEHQRAKAIIVNESTGRAWQQDDYRHWFSEVRRTAYEGVIDYMATAKAQAQGKNEPVYKIEPTPSLMIAEGNFKRDQDLRDTAVTWLANAGCSLLEICAITGHSPASAQTIMKHYLSLGRELADAGIAKLEAWMQREGIAV